MKSKRFRAIVGAAAIVAALAVFCTSAAAEVCTEYQSSDLLSAYTVSSAGAKSGLEINAKSVVLLEPKTKTLLYENNKDERLAPASVTKIMSLLLIMEAIDGEKISYDTKVTASAHAASMGGSQIWLKENEVMTVDELLRAAVIASANDATVALAEAVAGSEETFVEQMNAKAAQMGLKNTHFVNACGLDANDHYTSAFDVAVMSAELLGHEGIKKYSTVWMDALRNGKSELVNTNKLVRYYSGATGLKTGTTSKAGCCVSATAERGGLSLVAVVMGAKTSNERFAGAKKLLDYGFANWSFCQVQAKPELLTPVPVKGGLQKQIQPEAAGSLNLLLQKGKNAEITQTVTLPESLNAPVLTGQEIGKITLSQNGKQLGEITIISGNTVDALTFFSALGQLAAALLCP